MSEIINNSNIILNNNEPNNVTLKTYVYDNVDMIAGELFFSVPKERNTHVIMLANRFNSNGIEENGPFPGWWLQIVGNQLSLGFGNGKTWISVKATNYVVDDKLHHVVFGINNTTKKAELYLDGIHHLEENIYFKHPCNVITIGALNQRNEFVFPGKLSNISLGGSINVNNLKSFLSAHTKQTNNILLDEMYYMVDNIENNVNNLDNDIESLNDIRNKIESWKFRGLSIDTQLLDNQIDSFTSKKTDLMITINESVEILKILDDQIKPHNEPDNNDSNIFGKYRYYINNLNDDVKILDNVIANLSEFTDLGIKLGSAITTIDEQKNIINNILYNTKKDLSERNQYLLTLTEIVSIDTNNL
jgi:hypothetical protein